MLITLEGLDGSGKTTVWEVLREEFPDFVFTREPTFDGVHLLRPERSVLPTEAGK